MGTEFELEGQKCKNKELTGRRLVFLVLFFQTLMFQTSVHCFFFSTCHAVKTWFELLRVELYSNDQRGSKN